MQPSGAGLSGGRAGGEPLGTDGHSPDTPTHALQFNNLGQRALPISVVFWVPIQLNQVTVWDDPQVTFSQVSPTGPEEWAPLLPAEPWSFLKSQIPLLDSGAFVTLVWTSASSSLAGGWGDPGALVCLSRHRVSLSSESLQFVPQREAGPAPL